MDADAPIDLAIIGFATEDFSAHQDGRMLNHRSGCVVLILCLLLSTSFAGAGEKKKRLLLLGQSPDGHPRGTHEYLPGVRLLAKLLSETSPLDVQVVNVDGAWEEGPRLLKEADGAVLFVSEGAKWASDDPRRLQALGELASRGGGFTALHWGMGTRDAKNIAAFLKLFGGCHGGPDRKYKVVEAGAQVQEHPIASGLKNFRLKEEWYYRLKFVDAKDALKPVLRVPIEGNLETVCWAWRRTDGGRSFGFSGLHFHENWRLPQYQRLLAQGVLWTMKQPIPKGGIHVDDEVDEALLKLD